MKRALLAALAAGISLAIAALLLVRSVTPTASGPLRQEAYVWQRSWTPAVKNAVGNRPRGLEGLVVLAAEVSFDGGRPRLVRTEMDRALLQRTWGGAGLAVRVGAYAGSFDASAPATQLLTDLSAGLVHDAAADGLNVTEFQIDFDCPQSKLAGYRQWVERLRRTVAPIPLTITALPSWLASSDLKGLVQSTDGFVLQVHSLDKPRPDRPIVLCDIAAARSAVAKAARLGKPFRVALPTYGYLVAFDAQGRLIGLSAEGPSPAWPPEAAVRSTLADPSEMASMVAAWTRARPAAMQGILWYRLPTEDDALNWRPATFQAVMDGKSPRPALRAKAEGEGGLAEIVLLNEGDAPASLSAAATARWTGAALQAADALGGFERPPAAGASELRLTAGAAARIQYLQPGDRRAIGWLRLDKETEVQVDVVAIPP